jgi:hypothetical protein
MSTFNARRTEMFEYLISLKINEILVSNIAKARLLSIDHPVMIFFLLTTPKLSMLKTINKPAIKY